MRINFSISIIDDDLDTSQGIQEILNRLGYDNVTTFASGKEFLSQHIENNISPNLVLLDIELPELNGIEVIKKAFELQIFDSTIFVSFSSYLTDNDKKWLGSVGFYLHLIKPVGMEELRDITNSILQNQSEIIENCKNKRNIPTMINLLAELRIRTAVLENNYIKKLISPEIFELIDKGKDAIHTQLTSVSVGFIDIREFTKLMNRIEIEQIDILLKIFFEYVASKILMHNGFLDKFIGDAVMWFNHKDTDLINSKNCIAIAVSILNDLKIIESTIQKQLHMKIPLKVGMGIASGRCAIGIFGAPNYRIQYSVIGPTINLASRLCGEARAGEILIGGKIIEHCNDQYITKLKGYRKIKGFDHRIEVHKVLVEKI